jgi:Domain of unknown function (DUF6268)
VLSLAFSEVFAQNYVELAKFYYSNTALNAFEQSDSSTRVKEFGLDITVPLLINTSDAILTGLIYERIETKLFEADPAVTFSVTGLRVGLSKKHSEKWSGTYLLVPKLASDFKEITWKDFQLGGIALLKYTKHENLNYKLGLYFNTELSGPFLAPLLGLYYLNDRKKIEVNLMLPFLADINYNLLSRLYVGANFTGMVRSYHLSETPTRETSGYVVKSSNEFSSYLKFNVTNALSLQARVGYSLGRSYRVYDDDDKITFGTVLIRVGDDRQQLNTDFADGFVYHASLAYRFVRTEK